MAALKGIALARENPLAHLPVISHFFCHFPVIECREVSESQNPKAGFALPG
jgi:hypothetical protein